MTKAQEYCKQNIPWIKTNLSEKEYTELAKLQLMARDFEFGGNSIMVTSVAKQIGVKIDWR